MVFQAVFCPQVRLCKSYMHSSCAPHMPHPSPISSSVILVTLITLDEEYKSWSSPLYSILRFPSYKFRYICHAILDTAPTYVLPLISCFHSINIYQTFLIQICIIICFYLLFVLLLLALLCNVHNLSVLSTIFSIFFAPRVPLLHSHGHYRCQRYKVRRKPNSYPVVENLKHK